MSPLESPPIQSKLRKIKLLLLDVDGVMTDGRVFWAEGTGWCRYFHIRDGYGLKLLQNSGIQVAVASGGDSKDLRARLESLKISQFFLGDENKTVALDHILESTGLKAEEIAFIGDDLFDIPVIERVGFSATVPGAVQAVKLRVDYITETEGGQGAVREIADAIRAAQGLGPY